MTNEKLLSIAERFALEGEIATVKPLGEGFINDTFIVRTAGDAPDYILQRKNHQVFPDVPGMMDNIMAVTTHIKAKVADPLRETLTVMNFVRQIDPDAFMTVGSVMGVYGRGFQPIKL